MRKKDLEVYRLALELAGTGKFKNSRKIGEKLSEKGYRRADYLLEDDKISTILDLRCEESHK